MSADYYYNPTVLGNSSMFPYDNEMIERMINKFQLKENSYQSIKGFKNGLMLNEVVKDSPTWTENDIVDRTKDLVEKAIKIFEL